MSIPDPNIVEMGVIDLVDLDEVEEVRIEIFRQAEGFANPVNHGNLPEGAKLIIEVFHLYLSILITVFHNGDTTVHKANPLTALVLNVVDNREKLAFIIVQGQEELTLLKGLTISCCTIIATTTTGAFDNKVILFRVVGISVHTGANGFTAVGNRVHNTHMRILQDDP